MRSYIGAAWKREPEVNRMRLERFGEGRALTHLDGSMPENVATDSSGPRSRSRLSLVSDDYEDEDAKLTLSWDIRSGKFPANRDLWPPRIHKKGSCVDPAFLCNSFLQLIQTICLIKKLTLALSALVRIVVVVHLRRISVC